MFAVKLNRSIVCAVLALFAVSLLLTGCGSSRNSGRGGRGNVTRGSQTSFKMEDYTRGISDPMAKALIGEAQEWIGTRYVYGGASRSGTDCSGLVMSVFNNVCGVKLPRSTREQVRYCTKIARNKMKPGDLVFFASEKADDKVSHVGLYIGEGRMIHASSSRGVMVSGFDSGYWGDRYFTGARIEGAPLAYASAGKRKKNIRSIKNIKEEIEILPPSYSPTESYRMAPAVEVSALPSLLAAPETTLSDPGTILSVAATSVPEPLPGSEGVAASTHEIQSPPSTIDLLDLIINQKVDSIFNSQFAD